MLYSMTGYGEHMIETEMVRAGFRLKTVNNKGLDLNLKIPFDLLYLEAELREILKEKLLRGRIDIFAEIEILDPEIRPETPLNKARLSQLRQMAQDVRAFDVTGELDINTLIKLPDLTLSMRVGFRLPDAIEKAIKDALSLAADALLESRAKEGEKLKTDLLKRLDRIEARSEDLQRLSQERRDELKESIHKRIAQAMEEFPIDDHRLYQEVVYHADRLDISEEITRLSAHIGTTRDLLNSKKRPMGKQLDFMCQEMLREVSTIGNKAKHKGIADLVVKLKTEYEKIREQVQNLE